MFKRDSKGNIREWEVGVQFTDKDGNLTASEDSGYARLVISSGMYDGKKVTTYKQVYGKNIGKKNETDARQQAFNEMQALKEKKYKQGYRDTIEEVDDVVKLPMLATKFEDRKKDIVYPALVQPKLNGVRCFARRDGDKIVYLSRTGESFETLGHFDKYLLELLEDGAAFDGEVYRHGWSLQRIVSALKKANEDTPYLQYWVYDSPMADADCETRLSLVREALLQPEVMLSPIWFTPTYMVDDEASVLDFTSAVMEEGFEGGMVRNTAGMYKYSFRSKDLQKVKFMQTEEFEIIGYDNEHIYNEKGTARNAVVWRCITKEGKEFMCRPRGTHEERIIMYNHADDNIGKQLTVQFQELSDDGVPIFPVGIVIRDYE